MSVSVLAVASGQAVSFGRTTAFSAVFGRSTASSYQTLFPMDQHFHVRPRNEVS